MEHINFMTPVPLGMRILDVLLRPVLTLSTMTTEQIEKGQTTQIPQNFVTNLLIGGLQKGIQVKDRLIDGPDGSLPIRIYTPEHAVNSGPRPLVVYFHGGGWMLGNLRSGDWMCSTVARDVDAIVVSVDYRLAPKFKFPAGIEDCYAALVWCWKNAASLGAEPDRIGVMGESAGGNLSAAVCLMTKARGGPKILHQALIYPATDATMSSESFRTNKDEVILTTADVKAVYRHYLGQDVDSRDWRLSPLFAPDHSALPAAIVVVAGHDPLRDDGVRYAEKLGKAGVPVTLKEYAAMPHAFVNFPHFARDAKAAITEITQAQRAHLSNGYPTKIDMD